MRDRRSADRTGARDVLAAVVLAATFLAATETIRAAATSGAPLWRAAVQNVPWWMLWVVATPFVSFMLRVLSVERFGVVTATLLHVPVAVATGIVHLGLSAAVMHPSLLRAERYPTVSALWFDLLQGYLPLDVVTYGALAGLMVSMASRARLREREQQAASLAWRTERLERDVAEARLDVLQRQLNPHYLFNCLNAIAGLARQNRSAEVVAMLARLGGFLRATLALHGRRLITLREELELGEQFLAIERVRFGNRVQIDRRIQPDIAEQTLVPPLLLQPLLENACRHGVAATEAPSLITLEVHQDGSDTVIRISNSPTSGAAESGTLGTGVGLRNTRDRLDAVYGPSASSLTLEIKPPATAVAQLRVPGRPLGAVLDPGALIAG